MYNQLPIKPPAIYPIQRQITAATGALVVEKDQSFVLKFVLRGTTTPPVLKSRAECMHGGSDKLIIERIVAKTSHAPPVLTETSGELRSGARVLLALLSDLKLRQVA